MSVAEYQKVSINRFMGLYARGLGDDCPPDHSTVAQNLRYTRDGETYTRDGFKRSGGAPANIVRMFVATFGHTDQTGILLTCDGAGNIYRSDTGAVLLSVPRMVDFAAINVFSFCLISPILSAPSTNNPVYIWSGLPDGSGNDTIPIRPAAGFGPAYDGTFTASESATAGDCDIGIHKIAVSFVTNTGYTTQPGPIQFQSENFFNPASVTSTGSKCITISGIPLGPSGTVSRQILLTQADQTLYFYGAGRILLGGSLVTWDGVIHDNITTSITISFFDTDLAVSADALFDLLPVIPGGTYGLLGGMTIYHGRVLFWGGEFNLIRVSNPGSSESVDNINGFIQIPDQFDGNDVSTSVTIQDTLYFFKQVGVFATTDNGGDPITWEVLVSDAGIGCVAALGLGTVNLTTPSQTQDQITLVPDYGGLYLFTGAIQQPPLTWKIDDIWRDILKTTQLQGTMVAVDPILKLIYVAITGNAIGEPGYPNLLVGDYNNGLDSKNIKWSIWCAPFGVSAIGMAFLSDVDELAYRFRLASGNVIYKYLPGQLTDDSNPIKSIWKSYYAYPEEGSLNVFRYIRARLPFQDNLLLRVFSQDDANSASLPGFNTPYVSGRDVVREFNFMDEKCAVQIGCLSSNGGFKIQRLDLFCKVRFPMRPQV